MSDNKETNKNNLQALLEIMKELDYIPGQKTLMTVLDYGKRKSMVGIEDKEFKDYLRYEAIKRWGKFVDDREIKTAISISRHDYKIHNDLDTEFAVRVYYDTEKQKLYYDLANNEMEYVEIDSESNISIKRMNFEQNPKFVFVRNNYSKPQVKPVPPKANLLRTLDYLDEFLNLAEDDKFLYKVWLIASFYPVIRTPIPYFVGEAGTGKSSMVTMINDLLDPSVNPLRNWDNSTQRDLAIDFSYTWNCNSDNISRIKRSISDLLCQTVTGGSMTFRQLYEDDKQISFDLRRRITISSVKKLNLADDLAQRVLFFHTKKMNYRTRISEDSFLLGYQKHKAEILYTIFKVLGCAISVFDEYRMEHETNYRLSNFYLFGELIASILDADNGVKRFHEVMKKQIHEQLHWNTENDKKFYEVLLFFVEGSGDIYKGSIKELHECLSELITEDYDCPVSDCTVIPAYESFSKTIHNYEYNIRMLGYEMEFWAKGKNKTASVTITKANEE